MPWKRDKYYVKNRRVGRRVVTEYIGRGALALMAAQLDQAEQRQRAFQRDLQRAERAQIEEQTAIPAAMREHRAMVADLVRVVLGAAGYHQHRGQWRKQRMTDLAKKSPTRQEFGALFERVAAGGSAADARALRAMVADYPNHGRAFDLSVLAIESMISHMPADPAGKAIARGRADALRKELAGEQPTVIERLLVEACVMAYLRYWMAEHAASDLGEASATAIEFWERRLGLCQQRYLRALAELARVRRLLNLPAPQVNINLPGGQQVNIAGDVGAPRSNL